MNRIPEKEIANIKKSISLVTLCLTRNIPLKKTGKNFIGKCPFHDDDKASFTVNPKENLFHCFGCNTGGDVIRFVELLDKCTFPEAVATLSNNAVKQAVKEENNHSFSSRDPCPQSISPIPFRRSLCEVGDRSRLLSLVADFYHAAFNQRKDGKDYLTKRGITDPALFSRFKAGFCAGSIRESIPRDGKMPTDLKTLGVITQDDREFFKGCVVFPIPDISGQVVNLYGRRIRNGQVNHLYLPGPKAGIFNGSAIKTANIVILVESILDALALIQAGYPGTIPCYGSSGIPDQILDELKNYPARPVYLCFDADAAGKSGAAKARLQLEAIGIAAKIKTLPDGHDPCSIISEINGRDILTKIFKSSGGKTAIMNVSKANQPEDVSAHNGKLRIQFAERTYELNASTSDNSRGKTTITVFLNEDRERFHLDTIDLYSARSRSFFARSVAELFGARDALIAAELLALIDPLEKHKHNSNPQDPDEKPKMTEEEKQEALSLLTATDIFDRILQDFEAIGYTGEETNKLIGYLAAISRKLDEPISICIQSRSAAGKSALQDAILSFVPPEDLIRYTRLTGQALFYKSQDSLKHKIMAIEEDVGARDANYSIRTIQSSKQLSIASAGRDPQTGKMRTDEHCVDGPVVIFLTTTEPELDGETASRFIFITIDESREATARIHEAQRARNTLEGLVMKTKTEKIIRKHHNAQRLLEDGMKVVIPFSEHLSFRTDSIRTRRDNQKYLSLIKAIAFLRQKQREIKTVEVSGEQIRYVEATLDDVKIANRLAAEVLGTSLDELSPPSRRLLGLIREMVIKQSSEHGIDPAELSFTRRDIREYTGWSDFQVKTHINQLVDLEYLYAVMGRKGREYIYELKYEGDMDSKTRFLSGLMDVEKLERDFDQASESSQLGG